MMVANENSPPPMRPVLLAALLLLAACAGEPPPKVSRGDTPPAFETRCLDGTPVRFPADLASKPVVIRFWADWCKYCEGEMKDIEGAYQRHKAEGLTVLAVNAGQDRATAAAFVGKLGISYPALLDEEAKTAKRYGVTGLPTTFFIGRDGKVAAKQVGEMTAEAFERQAAELVR
jgi:cytochrome c biogenesis protein CcmG, thiol:disulfide interchange protein DsbE